MPKLKLVSQIRMPVDIVPLPERKGYGSFAEMFEDKSCPLEKKLRWIARVCEFETLNSITKADIHAALKWLFQEGGGDDAQKSHRP